MKLLVPVVPVAKGSVSSIAFKTKEGKLRSRVFHSNASKKCEKAIRDYINTHFPDLVPLSGPVAVDVVLHLKRPKSVTRNLPYKKGLDSDKGARTILDALAGLVYVDDCQVTTLFVAKVYATEQEGIEIEVTQDYSDDDILYDSCAFDYRDDLVNATR